MSNVYYPMYIIIRNKCVIMASLRGYRSRLLPTESDKHLRMSKSTDHKREKESHSAIIRKILKIIVQKSYVEICGKKKKLHEEYDIAIVNFWHRFTIVSLFMTKITIFF